MDRLEAQLIELTRNTVDVGELIKKAVNNLSRMGEIFETGGVKERRSLVGSIFPEKLVFDGFTFKTARMNEQYS